MSGKLIIFSAPSGSGKSTIIDQLTSKHGLRGHFSISATSRAPRGEEQDGIHYHFLTTEEFKQRISLGDFLEYEEVYEGCFYGTLRSEIDDTLARGETALLDIDVKGALNIKKAYGDQALTLFIQPPSIDTLRQRLESRGTDSPEKIAERLAKAETELSYAPLFDRKIINDQLDIACHEAAEIIQRFIEGERRILLFPGSFNPMHVGHLSLANYLVERYSHRFDEVWLLLTPASPFKEDRTQLPTQFRAEWIQHLIHHYPKLKLSQEEQELTPPYYTINTIRHLKSKYPKSHFTLLIGADSLQTLPKWHMAEELLQELSIIAYPRPGYTLENISKEVSDKVEVLKEVPTFNISSTEIREMLLKGKALPFLLSTELTHPLYRQLHLHLLQLKH